MLHRFQCYPYTHTYRQPTFIYIDVTFSNKQFFIRFFSSCNVYSFLKLVLCAFFFLRKFFTYPWCFDALLISFSWCFFQLYVYIFLLVCIFLSIHPLSLQCLAFFIYYFFWKILKSFIRFLLFAEKILAF